MMQGINRSSNKLKIVSVPTFKKITKTDLPLPMIGFNNIKPLKIRLPK